MMDAGFVDIVFRRQRLHISLNMKCPEVLGS